MRRETASSYLKAAGIDVRGRGGGKPKPATLPEVITDSAVSKPASSAEVITDSTNSKPATPEPVITDSGPSRSPSASSCEPYRDLIARALHDGRTGMSIWQELVEKHGFTARYAAVQRFVRGLHDVASLEARVVIETRPGEEAQVDYGDGPMVRDAITGKYRRVRLFLLTLAHSRGAVRLLTEKSSTQIWAQMHEQLVSSARWRDRDRRARQPARGRAQARHLRSATQSALPRRPRALRRRRVALSRRRSRPQRQSRVGDPSHAACAARPALRIARRRAGVARSLGGALGRHAHPRHDEAPGRGDVWRRAPAPLAATRRAVSLLRVRRARRAPRRLCRGRAPRTTRRPPGWIGRSVRVQWDERHVRLLDPKTGALLREHLTTDPGRHRMQPADRPSRTPSGVTALLVRAHGIGAPPARSPMRSLRRQPDRRRAVASSACAASRRSTAWSPSSARRTSRSRPERTRTAP